MENFVVMTDGMGDIKLKAPNTIGRLPEGTGGYIDIFRSKRAPEDYELAKDGYKRIAYACANLNANACAKVPIRLYLTTSSGQRKSKLSTKKIANKQIDYICKSPTLAKQTRTFETIEEVIEHPVLNLLSSVNDFPGWNGFTLRLFTQLYQEVVGKSYWYIVDGPLGIPESIWVIPSQYLHPESNPNSNNLIDYFKYCPGTLYERKYNLDEIVQFLMPNLRNPYRDGLSPLEAAYEANQVSNKLIAHEDSFLENEARPDLIITPVGTDNAIGEPEAHRLEKTFQKKFSKQRIGGVFVTEEELKITPVNFPPRDLARLEIHKWSKLEIANAYDIPLAFLEGTNINRATLEGSREQHATNAIWPRLERYISLLNEELITRYDDTGRLFFAYDDPVPELREIKLQEIVQLVMNGIFTPNEGREEYNMQPLEGGDDLRPINVSPGARGDGTGGGSKTE